MKKDLQAHILSKNIFDKNETVVIALSGGIDSMVLFHILNTINLELNVIIAHVNHNKRDESFNEYEEIKRIADSKNVHFEGLLLEKELNGNFQEESRKKRYEFFYDVCKKYNANKLVLAHHSDDQIETVLMRLVRGSSFKGYSGIKEHTKYKNIHVLRPLLDLSKKDIVEYAKSNNITHFEDLSNKESLYTRNRYRNEIIPQLKEENPNLNKQINQFSTYLTLANKNLDNQRDSFLKQHFINGKVDIKAFKELDDIIKIKILKFIINSKSYDTVEVSFNQYEDMIELLLNENPNVLYNLSKGFLLVKEYDSFYIKKDYEKESVFLEINGVGEYIISHNIKYIFSHEKLGIKYAQHFELWYNDNVFPLYLRNRENGDKMKLHIGSKKVKDILIDQKIPTLDRENLILLASRDKVLWIPNIKKSLQDKSCKKKLYVYEVR